MNHQIENVFLNCPCCQVIFYKVNALQNEIHLVNIHTPLYELSPFSTFFVIFAEYCQIHFETLTNSDDFACLAYCAHA